MKFKYSIYAVIFLLMPFIAHAENEGRFYALTEAGQTKLAANTSSDYSFTSNSWNIGLGYEQDKTSMEFTYGSALSLSETYNGSTTELNFNNYTFVLNYKLWNTGNFRPFVGLGRMGGTRSYTGESDVEYSRNIYDLGLEVPLDDNSAIRIRYLRSFKLENYVTFSTISVGLLYRF